MDAPKRGVMIESEFNVVVQMGICKTFIISTLILNKIKVTYGEPYIC